MYKLPAKTPPNFGEINEIILICDQRSNQQDRDTADQRKQTHIGCTEGLDIALRNRKIQTGNRKWTRNNL